MMIKQLFLNFSQEDKTVFGHLWKQHQASWWDQLSDNSKFALLGGALSTTMV